MRKLTTHLPPAVRGPATAILLAAAYFVVAKLGLRYATIGESISPVWPPTGLAIAALLLLGRQYWPAVLAGAFLANVTTNVPVLATVAIACGNAGEAYVGAWLMQPGGGRRTPWRWGFDEPVAVRRFVFLAAPVAALVSASVGAGALALSGALPAPSRFPPALALWWAGDVVGALAVAPLVLSWAAPASAFPSRRATLEFVLLAAVSGLVAELVLGRLIPPALLPSALLPYLLFPIVIAAALRSGPRGATLATLVVAAVAIGGAARGGGPFIMQTSPATAVALLLYIGVLAVTGLVVGALGAERRRGETALRDANDSLRALIESSPVAIYALGPAGTVMSWNGAAERLYGWRADEVIGTPFPAAPTGERLVLHDTVMGGKALTGMEVTRRRKDGSTITINLSLAPLYAAGGQVRGVLAIAADLTELRQLESQYRHAQKVDAVGRLAGGIAHDFNNTLTAILSFSHLLMQDLPATGPARRDAEEIRRAAQRAAGLTRQLLAFSRQQVLDPRPIDLNALVKNAELMLRRVIGEDVELRTTLAPDLAAVRADPLQMEQVLVNLLVNARDAMPRGGVVTIETANVNFDHDHPDWHAPAAPGPHVLLSVTDTGVGMDASVKAHLFEPFFTTKEPGKGTGLGLATVYGIVKQSGGHIWAHSAPGAGASFRIYLPRIGSAAEPLPPTGPALAPADVIHGRETVLLVEDQEEVLGATRRGLESLGYTVLAARSGDQAVALAAGHDGEIHLLVTDVVMPGMSGRDLAYGLSRTRPGMRVLYVSGYPDQAVVHEGLLAPGRAFLQKPYAPDALAFKAREVLDGDRGSD